MTMLTNDAMFFDIKNLKNLDLATELLPVISFEEIIQEKFFFGDGGKIFFSKAETTKINSNSLCGNNLLYRLHSFIATLYRAYVDHRPVTITPDSIWLIILQGFAQHINMNSEKLRSKIVNFKDELQLEVVDNFLIMGNENNNWDSVVQNFIYKIKENNKGIAEVLDMEFSTTSLVEKTAFNISIMNSVQTFFSYTCSTMCGIPAVYLEGKTEDWQSMLDRVNLLESYGLDWWIEHVRSILKEFIETSKGNINNDFWVNMFKRKDSSGGPYISGWCIDLFPYIGFAKIERNQYLGKEVIGSFEGVTTNEFPTGISTVDFIWNYYGKKYNMKLLSGFMAVSQNNETLALRPEIGYIVAHQ